MFTYLGASTHLNVEDIDEKIISTAKIVYLEAYLLDNKDSAEAMMKAAQLARKYDRQVALTLSDKSCIDRHRQELKDFIRSYTDILFANDDEIKALFEEDDFYKTLDLIKPEVDIAALTRGDKGSVVVNNRVKIFVESETVENVVDTTGAGDAYAAGFLYGLTHGRTLGTCALIGNIAASEIISHYGARAEVSLRGFVRNKLRQYGKTL
jgi:sugar/nucleoside kinase (ribokinase family)